MSCLHKISCSVQAAPASWSYSCTWMSALLFAELLGNRNIGSQNCCCAFLELCLDMSGKYDKNKSGAAHHNTIVLHNAQWPCQKCLGFSSFSFGTIWSGAGLQTQTMAGVLIHVLAWRHRAPLCCCRVTQHTLSTRLQHYVATSTRCYTSRKQKLGATFTLV